LEESSQFFIFYPLSQNPKPKARPHSFPRPLSRLTTTIQNKKEMFPPNQNRMRGGEAMAKRRSENVAEHPTVFVEVNVVVRQNSYRNVQFNFKLSRAPHW